MKNDSEKLIPCPISKSSNRDEYNDLCRATGQTCPYFIDEGMSVCKSKTKCIMYLAKRWKTVEWKHVVKLLLSDTKSGEGVTHKYTNTIKGHKEMYDAQMQEINEEDDSFMSGLEEAIKNHQGSDEESEED